MSGLSPGERDRVLKAADAWWAVLVVDPVALWLLPRVAQQRRVTPMLLTLLAGVFGLGATVCFGFGQLRVGAVLYFLRYLLDQMDGKLARLRGTSSQLGGFVDAFSDVVVNSSAFLALGLRVLTDGRESLGVLVVVVAVPVLSQTEAWARTWWHAVASSDQRAHAPLPTVAGVDRLLARVRSGCHRRRLAALPSTVEAETLVLVVVPLVGVRALFVPAFVVAAAILVLSLVLKAGWTVAALRGAQRGVGEFRGTVVPGVAGSLGVSPPAGP